MLDDLDAVAASPDHHRVLFEDDRVRVIETLIRPGEQTAVHTHVWGGFMYIVGWSDFERHDPDGVVLMDSARIAHTPVAGTVIASLPLPAHSLRNVGTGDIHVIMTEYKTA